MLLGWTWCRQYCPPCCVALFTESQRFSCFIESWILPGRCSEMVWPKWFQKQRSTCNSSSAFRPVPIWDGTTDSCISSGTSILPGTSRSLENHSGWLPCYASAQTKRNFSDQALHIQVLLQNTGTRNSVSLRNIIRPSWNVLSRWSTYHEQWNCPIHLQRQWYPSLHGRKRDVSARTGLVSVFQNAGTYPSSQ